MYLCTSVSEEGGDGESVVSETLTLLSYTLVRLTDLDRHGESATSEALSLMSYTVRFEGSVVYYESRKRELKIRLMNEGRSDERLKDRVEEST